ncbi:MAG TPA: hypothetical protein VHC18_06305 [Amycolatopsis sp.]|nr:hypothetical protein [Amycolatopsis sp.]
MGVSEPSPPVLGTAAGRVGELYEKALIGLIVALGLSGEGDWQSWIREDVRIWRASGETGHHRQAYGGMGSLNDRPIGADPWLDAAAIQLVGIAYETADRTEQQPERFVQVGSAARAELRMSWHRCTACAREYIGQWHLQAAASAGWASWVVPRLITDETVITIESALGVLTGVQDESRKRYLHHVERHAADLGLRRHELGRATETPCPSCGDVDWRYVSASAF